MARERIIEGTWKCTSCGTDKIAARRMKCPTCNNPREQSGDESRFDFGARTASGGLQRQEVTDEEGLRRAQVGPDWFCGFCGTSNAADLGQCGNCHAPRAEQQGQAQVRPLDEPVAAQAVPEAAAAPTQRRRWPYVLGAAVLLLGGAVVWATRSHDEQAQVVEARWSRTLHRERFTRVTQQGWRDQLSPGRAVMPVGGRGESPGVENIRACRREQRGTRQVQIGTQRVCHTRTRQEQCGTEEQCTVTDLGNGMAKEVCHDVPRYCDVEYEDCADEPRYRDEPVYADRCEYDTHVWQRVDTRTAEGAGDAPAWPAMAAAGAVEREVREEQYVVRLRYGEGKEHTVTPRSEDEYLRWRAATRPHLRVTNLGLVTEATPE